MTTGPGPDRRVAGSRSAPGFDVMVGSMDALNASVRQLSQDIRRAFDANSRFTPGRDGDASRRARDEMPDESEQPDYDPQAGQTNQRSVRRAAQSFAQRMFSSGQQQSGQQQQFAPPPPPPMFGTPPYGPGPGPMYPPYGPYGGGGGFGGGYPPYGPYGGGGGFGGGGGGHGGGHHGGYMGPSWFGPMVGGHGGGWTNMLIGGTRRVPYVGTAIAIGAGTAANVQSEREKSRFYQGMEGGGIAGGTGERMHEEAYRWSQAPGFGMSGDMARRAFKGVTAMGYTRKSGTGQGRQDALDFVYHNYTTRGMDVEESLGMLQTASHDATIKFGELSEALKSVSDTAGKAGVNAKFMRQSFQSMLDASIKTGAGPGSADLAGIFSTTQASYGREMQGMNFEGQLDTSYQYMVGAQYGVAPGRLQGIMRNQPGQYARMVSGSQRSVINMVFSPAQANELQALLKKYGNSQQAIPMIEQEFLNNHPEIDLNVIASVLSGPLTGVELDNSNVMDWVIQQLSGNTAAAHAAQSPGNKPVNAKNTEGARVGKFGLVAPKGNESIKDQLGDMNVHGPGDSMPGARFFSETKNKAGQSYLKDFYNKGKRDPVLEAILQNVKNPNSTKVRVSTSKGDRIISFEEAMRLYPNEMASGKVQFVTGEEAGKNTSDITGGNVDPGRDISGELTGAEGQRKGETVPHYEKKHGKIKAPGGDVVNTRVTVDLTTEAKRLLQVLPSVNNESQSTGYPPYNPNSRQGSRGGP